MSNVYGWAKVFVSEKLCVGKHIEIYGEDILSGDVEFAGTLTMEVQESGYYFPLTGLEWEVLSVVVDQENLVNSLLAAIANNYRVVYIYRFEMVYIPLCVSHGIPLKFEYNNVDYTYTYSSSSSK